MLILAGTVDIHPDDLDKAIEGGRVMIAETLKEDGCIDYNFAADITRPGRIRIFEIWRDADALKAHGESAHMAVWRGILSGLRVEARKLKTWDASNEQPFG